MISHRLPSYEDLKILHIQDCKINDYTPLKYFKNLEEVQVGHRVLSEDEIDELRKIVPGIAINPPAPEC